MTGAQKRIAARRTERLRQALAASEMTWAEICREFGCSRRMLVALRAEAAAPQGTPGRPSVDELETEFGATISPHPTYGQRARDESTGRFKPSPT